MGGWGVLGPISTLFCPILFFLKNFVLFYPVFVGWKGGGPGGVEKIHTFFFLKASLNALLNSRSQIYSKSLIPLFLDTLQFGFWTHQTSFELNELSRQGNTGKSSKQLLFSFNRLCKKWLHCNGLLIFFNPNKMELLQSQAPVDRAFSGTSASVRHGTFDIGHQKSDMGHRNLELLKRSYFQRGQNKAEAFLWNFFKIFK